MMNAEQLRNAIENLLLQIKDEKVLHRVWVILERAKCRT